jgi:surface antigen
MHIVSLTTLQQKLSKFSRKRPQSLALASLVLAGLLFLSTSLAQAVSFQQQINELQQQNNQNAAAQEKLETSEASLAETVDALQRKIAAIQAQITKNRAESQQLKKDIEAKKREIIKQRGILGSNIRQHYLDGEMSTLEKLATSKDLGDYVDKEQYTLSAQQKIKDGLETIKKLQQEQQDQKKKVDKLLADQQIMQNDVAAQKAESNRLLGLNRSEQQEYEEEIGANNARIAELRAEQAALNAQSFIGGTWAGSTNYPWANAPFPNSITDPWGMYQRQCVSYTAWKVASSGRHMPYWGGFGNANQWDDNARAAGIPVDTNPRVGDVAVDNNGYYGHVMYVEAVHDDGTITISQYNASWTGQYSEGRRSAAGLYFIHF